MVLKEQILTVTTLGGCAGLERTHLTVSAWVGEVVLKELMSTVSTLGGCGGLERLILTVSTLGRCGGLERIDFNCFYIGQVWWS